MEKYEIVGSVVHSQILLCLMKGITNPTDIAKERGVSRAGVSNHLQMLYNMGYVKKKAMQGKYQLYEADIIKIIGYCEENLIKNLIKIMKELDRNKKEKNDNDKTWKTIYHYQTIFPDGFRPSILKKEELQEFAELFKGYCSYFYYGRYNLIAIYNKFVIDFLSLETTKLKNTGFSNLIGLKKDIDKRSLRENGIIEFVLEKTKKSKKK